MNTDSLKMILPPIILILFAVGLLWTYFRKRKHIRIVPNKNDFTQRINAISIAYQTMMVIMMIIVFVYAYLPEYYGLVMPIDSLDHPLINIIGVLILKLSLAWLVVAQLSIDKIIYQVNSGLEEWSYRKLALYSQKLLLSGFLMMFFGFLVTISSLGTILICLIGIALFEKFLALNRENQTIH